MREFKKSSYASFALVLFFTAAGCHAEAPPSDPAVLSTLVGKWQRPIEGGTETFEFRSDGTFRSDQTLTDRSARPERVTGKFRITATRLYLLESVSSRDGTRPAAELSCYVDGDRFAPGAMLRKGEGTGLRGTFVYSAAGRGPQGPMNVEEELVFPGDGTFRFGPASGKVEPVAGNEYTLKAPPHIESVTVTLVGDRALVGLTGPSYTRVR
jgi:hypothetical protein